MPALTTTKIKESFKKLKPGGRRESLRGVCVDVRGQPPAEAEQDLGQGRNVQRWQPEGGHDGKGKTVQAADEA